MKRSIVVWLILFIFSICIGCGSNGTSDGTVNAPRPVTPTPPPDATPSAVIAEPAPIAAVQAIEIPAADMQSGINHGLVLTDAGLQLFTFEDTFTEKEALAKYKIGTNASMGIDEFGIIDTNTDAAMITVQSYPDNSILIETYDNDSVNFSFDVMPTLKGVLTFDIWPLRLWPTSGKVGVSLRETGKRQYSYHLAGSDYIIPTSKQYDENVISVKGGRPFFSSIAKADIYTPNEIIPFTEQRWWPIRFLFRPAYAAGSLDGSVCREIEDPAKNAIEVKRIELDVSQLETYIRALRFKALLGEAETEPQSLTGSQWLELDFSGNMPKKTRIGLQVRGADSADGIINAPWLGPDNAEQPYYLESGPVPEQLQKAAVLQVKVLLKADQDTAFRVSPVFEELTIIQEGSAQ